MRDSTKISGFMIGRMQVVPESVPVMDILYPVEYFLDDKVAVERAKYFNDHGERSDEQGMFVYVVRKIEIPTGEVTQDEFKPGDKVVCLEAEGSARLRYNEVYTVAPAGIWIDRGVWPKVLLAEFVEDDGLPMWYPKCYFRKVKGEPNAT